MKPKSAFALAIIVPAVFASGAIAATKHAPAKSSTTATKNATLPQRIAKAAARAPEVSVSLDRTSYASGAAMTLTVTENIWAKNTLTVVDTSGTTWKQQSATQSSTVYTANAGKNGTVTVTLLRTWDRASDSAQTSYTVASPAPTPPPPAPPAPPAPTPPPPPAPTPPPPPPAPEPASAAWPGQVPGQFYLGMSCGVVCADKEAGLGQSYGVHRQFKQWANWTGMAKAIQQDHAANRLPWVSFKPPQTGAPGWAAIASGAYDSDLKALATMLKANDDKPVLLTFNHEPSNDSTDVEGLLWADAYVHIHDLLAAEGALENVSDPPILGDWLFNPRNGAQNPFNWATKAVLQRAPFMGIDLYENASGETMGVRLTRVLDWMAAQGFPKKMVGVGETGSTDADYATKSAVDWMNESLSWVANNTDKVGVVSYFNSVANSKENVYWPLDESAAKMATYRSWLDKPVTID